MGRILYVGRSVPFQQAGVCVFSCSSIRDICFAFIFVYISCLAGHRTVSGFSEDTAGGGGKRARATKITTTLPKLAEERNSRGAAV